MAASSTPTASAGQAREMLASRADRSLPLLIEMTQALVRVASPNPPTNTTDIARAVERLLAEIPRIDIRRVEPEPGVVSLVARLRGKGAGRRLTFNGHLDTFPVGDETGWTEPPLSGALSVSTAGCRPCCASSTV